MKPLSPASTPCKGGLLPSSPVILAAAVVAALLTTIAPQEAHGAPLPFDWAASLGVGGGFDDGYVEGPLSGALIPSLSIRTREGRRLTAALSYNGRLRGYGEALMGASEHQMSFSSALLARRTRRFNLAGSYSASDNTLIPDLGEGARASGPRSHLHLAMGPTFFLSRRKTLSIEYRFTRRTANRYEPLSSSSHGIGISGTHDTSRRGQVIGATDGNYMLLTGGGHAISQSLFVGYRYRLTRFTTMEAQGGPFVLWSPPGPIGERAQLSGFTWGTHSRIFYAHRGFETGLYVERNLEPHPLEIDILWTESLAGRFRWEFLSPVSVTTSGGLYRSGEAPSSRVLFIGGWMTLGARVSLGGPLALGLEASRFMQKAYDDPLGLTISRNVLLVVLTAGLPSLEAIR